MVKFAKLLSCFILLTTGISTEIAAAQDFAILARPTGPTNMHNLIAKADAHVRSTVPAWFPKDIAISTRHAYTERKTKSGYFADEIWLNEFESYVKRDGRCWIEHKRNIVGVYSTVTYGAVRHVTTFGQGAATKLLSRYQLAGRMMATKGWGGVIDSQDKSILQWAAEQIPHVGTMIEMGKGALDTEGGLNAWQKAHDALEKFRREYEALEAEIDFRKGRIVTLVADYDMGVISGVKRTIDGHAATSEAACEGAFWTNANDGQTYSSAEVEVPVRGQAARELLAMMATPAAGRDNARVAALARLELAVWHGGWDTKRGGITLVFTGSGIDVILDPRGLLGRHGGSVIVTHATEQFIAGEWRIPSQRLAGTFRWTLTSDGRRFTGQFSESIGDVEARPWSGQKR